MIMMKITQKISHHLKTWFALPLLLPNLIYSGFLFFLGKPQENFRIEREKKRGIKVTKANNNIVNVGQDYESGTDF